MLGLPLSKLNSVSNFISKQKRSKKGFVGFVVSIYTIHTLSLKLILTLRKTHAHTQFMKFARIQHVYVHMCVL